LFINPATPFILSAEPTDVPPNFNTFMIFSVNII
jgi:hypothetical protein